MKAEKLDGQNIKRVKLIFNPGSGVAEQSPVQLMDILSEMQDWNLVPEPYLVGPDSNLLQIVHDALKRDFQMFVVCGGDGTIENVAGALVGTQATLGIVPTGTRNNVAKSLGIPNDIPGAVALLQTGHRLKVDVGVATCGEISRFFLEICSVGLLSALFPAADDIQHGKLEKIGDFLATLFASPSAEMRLVIDSRQEINIQGHLLLAANLPFVGPHFQIAPENSFADGLLDLLVFPDLSKMDLLSNVALMAGGGSEDPRIRRYQVQQVEIATSPPMPVMADCFSLGEGRLNIGVKKCALRVMAGVAAKSLNVKSDE